MRDSSGVDEALAIMRGIVSASDIARALHIPLLIGDRANSFADIYRALH